MQLVLHSKIFALFALNFISFGQESKTTARGGGLNIIALEGALIKVQLLK